MTYAIAIEKLSDCYGDIHPLCVAHYGEMADRLKGQGVEIPKYQPRYDEYEKANAGGWLLVFVLRHEGKACGYSNIYVTNDMHNGELIAQEDTVYVTHEHRNGIGKKLVRHVLDDLKARGVKKLTVSAMTDLRVAKIWARMGFKEVAVQMCYTF